MNGASASQFDTLPGLKFKAASDLDGAEELGRKDGMGVHQQAIIHFLAKFIEKTS